MKTRPDQAPIFSQEPFLEWPVCQTGGASVWDIRKFSHRPFSDSCRAHLGITFHKIRPVNSISLLLHLVSVASPHLIILLSIFILYFRVFQVIRTLSDNPDHHDTFMSSRHFLDHQDTCKTNPSTTVLKHRTQD